MDNVEEMSIGTDPAVVIVIQASRNRVYTGGDQWKSPAEKIIPHQVLLLRKHRHHNEGVEVNAFTEHPEVVTAHQVKMNKLRHFTTDL